MSDSPSVARLDLSIRGMHCAACVSNVERALRTVSGVRDASVNLAAEQASVWLESAQAERAEELIDAVRGAGYDAAPAQEADAGDRAARRAERLQRQRREVVLAGLFTVPLVALHFTGHAWLHAAGVSQVVMYVVQGALAVTVVWIAGREMIRGAAQAALRGQANMDLLVSLGAASAFVSGLAGAILGIPELVLFEAAAMIVFFVSLGKYFEARSRGQASAALEALASRLPQSALRVVAGVAETTPIAAVLVGDRLRVPNDALVPVDGEIVEGRAAIDESILTGESQPVGRGAGEPVLGGTRVVEGLIEIVARTTGVNSAASRVARLVQEAQASKPPWQRLADRVAGVFVPVVVSLALLTFLGWWTVGRADLGWSLQRMIAVLVVACPCALGLAIPTAVLVGTTRAAERGIVVRDSSALEAAGRLQEVLLDKTGTLTLGRPHLDQIVPAGPATSDAEILRIAAALAQMSSHPLSKAISVAAETAGAGFAFVKEFAAVAGAGMRGVIDKSLALLGSARWLQEHGVSVSAQQDVADAAAARGQSVVWLAHRDEVVALLCLSDTVHPGAKHAVESLHRLGVQTRILSGDRHAAVSHFAGLLGVHAFEAELTPQQKLDRLRELTGRGIRTGMVGDGVNDAPALAAATVGIAIGTGADVARESADICLVGHSPELIAAAIRISRQSTRVMWQNLFWATIYNAMMLPLAALSSLPPAYATIAMMGSSLTVVANSLRLRRLL